MRQLTTKWKIGLLTGVVSLLVTAGVVAVFYQAFTVSLNNEIRTSLYNLADDISRQYVQGAEITDTQALEGVLTRTNASFILLDTTGTATAKLGEKQLLSEIAHEQGEHTAAEEEYAAFIDPVGVLEQTGAPYFASHLEAGSESFALLLFPISENSEQVAIGQLAMSTNQLNTFLQIGSQLLLIVAPLALLFSILAGVIISRFALRLIKKVATHMSRVSSEQLNDYITLDGNPKDTIVQLSQAFNTMLDRIDEGIHKQKQFVSHASHELKTPIARAVSTIDTMLLRKNGISPVAHQQLTTVKKDLFSLSDTIEHLLFLSKMENTQELQSERVHLRTVVERVLGPYEDNIAEESLSVEVAIPEDLHISFFLPYLEILLHNAISNAIKYNFPSGQIHITATENALCIQNTGQKMKDPEKAFERFYRDPAHASKTTGSGLGLSIMAAIAKATHTQVTLESNEEHTELTLEGLTIAE